MKWAAILLYVGVLVTVGLLSARKTKSVSDFFLGGRSIGPWISAFAYGTTYFSAVIFIGYAGKIGWGFGLSDLWIVAGNVFLGTYLAWKVLARPTREMTARLGVLTMPAFLEARYQSRGLKILGALVIFIFLVPYSASVYMGLSYLLEGIFGVPYRGALALIAGLTALYLVLGGYFAVTLNDFIQGLIMLVGSALLISHVLAHPYVGGLAQGISRLASYDPGLVKVVGPPGALPLFSLVILTSLGTWGLPQMVQKFYSIKDERAIRPATVVSSVFALVITFAAYFTGALGRLFLNNHIPVWNGRPNPDLVMPHVVAQALPEVLSVIVLLLVLAASMSTLASLVLVSSSAISLDLVKGALFPRIGQKAQVLLLRTFCLLFTLLSVVIALTPTFIVTLMSISWGTVAGVFLAPYLYGLYYKGTTRAGAWAGALTGLGLSLGLAWYYHMDDKLIPTIGSVAMIVPLVVVPLISWVTNKLREEHLSWVFGDRGGFRKDGTALDDVG